VETLETDRSDHRAGDARASADCHWPLALRIRASNAHHCENPITVGAWAQKEACDRKKTSRDATEPN
jgi:hypothetical protein